MILVDQTRTYRQTNLRQKNWCHMISDLSDPVEAHAELMDMAAKIGLRSEWLQGEGTWKEHFDLVPTKRALAIVHGAREADSREIVAISERRMKHMQEGHHAPVETAVLSDHST